MSLLDAMRKSVFAANIHGAAGGAIGQSTIAITSTTSRFTGKKDDYTVTGVLQNEKGLTFEVGAKWEAMDFLGIAGGGEPSIMNEVAGAIHNVAEYSRWIGVGVGDAGIATRKFYKGHGSYISISPQLRVVDEDGTGEPLLAAVFMHSLCLPSRLLDSGDLATVTDVVNSVKEWLGKQDSPINRVKAWAAENGTNPVAKLVNKTLETAGEALTVDNIANLLTQAPSPVEVRIGNYFFHPEMIIEKVSTTFSRETTAKGPLYVDFELELSSMQAMTASSPNGIQPVVDRSADLASLGQ